MTQDGQTAQGADPTAEDRADAKLDRLFGGQQSDEEEPAIDSGDAEAADEQQEGQGEDPEEQDAKPAEPKLEEVEIDGEIVRVPPKVKSALMRQQDYTRKTMEVAEERKLVRMHREAMEQEAIFRKESEAELRAVAEAEAELARFNAIDWTQLDTDQMVRTKHAYDQLKEKRDEARAKLQEKYQAFQAKQMQLRQQAVEQGIKYLKTVLPQWNDTAREQVKEFAASRGFTADEINSLYDPRLVRVMYEAAQYARLQAQKGQAAAKAAQAPPVVKPGASTPELSAKMASLRMRKDLKNAKSNTEKLEIAGRKLDRFFK